MTEDTALRLIGKLIVCTNGWDEARVRGWTMMLMDLNDDQAAIRAVDAVCRNWKAASPPPWGQVINLYESAPRRMNAIEQTTGPSMTFHAYLSKLKARALEGNRDAARELAQWKHYVSTSNTWMSAIGGDPA